MNKKREKRKKEVKKNKIKRKTTEFKHEIYKKK